MKRIIYILFSILLSWLFSSYAYATFDITKIPTEAKYCTAFGCLVFCGLIYVVESDIIKTLKDRITKLEKESK